MLKETVYFISEVTKQKKLTAEKVEKQKEEEVDDGKMVKWGGGEEGGSYVEKQ